MIKLQNCFSCGKPVRWCGEDNPNPEDDHTCHQITCDYCGIQFDVDNCVINNLENMEEVRAHMALVWNRRAKKGRLYTTMRKYLTGIMWLVVGLALALALLSTCLHLGVFL